jgi:hypothetical protein
MVSTVKENKEGFTKRQFNSATAARAFYHVVGCPTLLNFKHIICQGIFKNCPVTVVDVDVAKKIFGPDLGSLKGKSTRHPPARVKEDLIEIPPELTAEHDSLTLYMDIMFVNGSILLWIPSPVSTTKLFSP